MKRLKATVEIVGRDYIVREVYVDSGRVKSVMKLTAESEESAKCEAAGALRLVEAKITEHNALRDRLRALRCDSRTALAFQRIPRYLRDEIEAIEGALS